MLTRSKSAAADLDKPGQAAPLPSSTQRYETTSRASVTSNSTAASIRRQRILDARRATLDKLADVERRRLELEENLIKDQAAIEIEALENDEHDLQRHTISSSVLNFNTARRCESTQRLRPDRHADSAPTPPTGSVESQLSKFMARQTTNKDLPVFSGAPEEWLLFYSQFKATSKLCGYSDSENIARLVKCLRGEARDSVSALLISGKNLDKIIATLKIRFGRPDLIIETMLSKIKTQSVIRHDDMGQLLKYATEIQNIVATMISTEQIDHLRNPTLIRDVLSKLPSALKYQWGLDRLRRNITYASLEDISEWLMEIATATADFIPIATSSSYGGADKRHAERYRPQQPSVAAPFKAGKKTTVLTTAKVSKECPMCKDSHDLEKCTTFTQLSVDERWKFVTETKLCFSCLSSKHQLKTCRRKTQCPDCTRAHHSLLHAEPLRADQGETTEASVNHCADANVRVLLKVVPVIVQGPKGDVETLALLDEGASLSLADSSLLERAGITGPTVPLDLRGARGMTSTVHDSKTVAMDIRARDGSEIFNVSGIRSVNNLSLPVYSVNFNKIVNKFPFLKDFVQDMDVRTYDKRPLLLLGADNLDLIVTRKVYVGPKNGPVVSDTKLGRVIHGRLTPTLSPNDSDILHLCCDSLTDLVKESFRTDDFGVKPTFETPRSRDDMKALDIMKSTTHFLEDRKRWETGLLWRQDVSRLPDSYGQAYVRLQGIKRKMAKMPDFARKYNEKIDDYLNKGYATKLTREEASLKSPRTWYLPHFAVFNPNKPNKLRFVLDAAAKSEGKSLNDFLYPGPDYLNSLPGILLTFRCHQYAVIGDIQEMFHQVLMIEEDRDALRFLWGNDEYCMNVMIFGAVCSPSSAQYVKNVNAERFSETHPRAVEAIVHRHYMDDFIDSVDTESEAVQLVDDVIRIHKLGGFNMTSLVSNSKDVLQRFPEKLSSSGERLLQDATDHAPERVLGTFWSPDDDNFIFNFKKVGIDEELETDKRPTKRDILRVTMSVFDPLGFLLFVVMGARILLQDLWKTKLGWDDEIEVCLFDRWRQWQDRLRRAVATKVPRWFLTRNFDSTRPVELHVFCDASSRAFASVAYIRSVCRDESYHVVLAMARGRVAPLKALSIPRLELQAAVLGTRVAAALKKYIDLPISRVVYWTDSKTVLSWIRSDSGRFKPFVAHRVSEIADVTEPSEWRWVPTHLNCADLATREDLPQDVHLRWTQGPDFLSQDENMWPSDVSPQTDLDIDDPEVKHIHLLTGSYDVLPDDTRFSNYWRLVRATAWILRLRHNLTNKNDRRRNDLLLSEVREAELLLIKRSQERSFGRDIRVLRTSQKVDSDSSLYELTPFLDNDGVVRVKGRLDSADIDYDVKYPIILHPKDRFTRLLIDKYHRDSSHVGKEQVLSSLRQRFWIIRGRSAVNAAWKCCQVCKHRLAVPTPPLMGQIPSIRLANNKKVFSMTGLDYFGPMTIKVGRKHEKRYGALFTCLTVRAIHIELTNDLTTDSAILALRRFIARRGVPQEMWSDNATTFRGAATELKTAVRDLDETRLRQFYTKRHIDWKFICPNSPHHGGCWERLVRSVKTALKITLKDRAPTEQTLLTVLTETEFTVNQRPLTHVSLDSNDQPPLTPNDFIFGVRTVLTCPTGEFNDSDLLRNSWRHSQRLSDLVWQRWVREYLPDLTRRTRWFRTVEPLKIDDLVVICDSGHERNLWPRGIVTKTYPTDDGQVRVVDVRTVTGTYRRPVTKLAKLDLTCN